MKTSVIKQFSGISSVNMEIIWNILSHMIAYNSGFHLFIEKSFRPILLSNLTDIPFLVGDQPLFNTYTACSSGGSPPTDFELFYPIDPKNAILYTKNPVFISNRLSITADKDIDAYNKVIIEESLDQTYSVDESTLMRYLPSFTR